MSLAEDQHAVEEFAAQGADEAFADRVHAGNLARHSSIAPVAWTSARNALLSNARMSWRRLRRGEGLGVRIRSQKAQVSAFCGGTGSTA
jgi:hypothetical protein